MSKVLRPHTFRAFSLIRSAGRARLCAAIGAAGAAAAERPAIEVRAVYGGVPVEIFAAGKTLADYGINAVFLGSGSINAERVAQLRAQNARVFAEFNTMHDERFVKENPDAAPGGADGKPSPPPHGWQGACPTHPGYRAARMKAFRALVDAHTLDGVWLDYHHGHASWERADPALPDTCFCRRCLALFERDTGVRVPEKPTPEVAALLLSRHRGRWLRWRAGVFTDWVREFRQILDQKQPRPLLGSFHCPWTNRDFDGALFAKLAIDLKAQARYLDVFSPMPYHARFGHAADPEWISRQVRWLGRHLGREARIWPIVQLSDWGEAVPAGQVPAVLDHGSRRPATGVIVFAWGSLRKQWEKVEAMGKFYRSRAR